MAIKLCCSALCSIYTESTAFLKSLYGQLGRYDVDMCEVYRRVVFGQLVRQNQLIWARSPTATIVIKGLRASIA